MRHTSALLISLLGILLIGAGCADNITFSRDAREHGVGLYNQQQYADAAGSFRNATKQNPRDYGSFYMLGCCYEQMGEHQQAIVSFRTALDVQNLTQEGKFDDDQRSKTIAGLAAAIARSDTRDIETNATVARAHANQLPDDFLLLGHIYAMRGDADSAIEAFDHASLLAPERFDIAKTYGLYLEKLDQKSRAEAALRRAYALNPMDEQVNLGLRRCGVVPGPSILSEKDLARPTIPRGPLPELDLTKLPFITDNKPAPATVPPPAPANSSAQLPRD